eukprot:TRINITY_DN25373_c0_g1_i5.p1 TRINITY_DN25373_c0_g1~~TRINITY_DN25373_c0_g1_i5.p1  ORF type:complete len:429 (+),score=129.34 TRINITY_DN25373_c0_g1_i5:73-1359(+)
MPPAESASHAPDAPSDSAGKTERHIDSNAMLEALQGASDKDLQEMCLRLEQSIAALRDSMSDVQQERETLQDEKTHLEATIDLMHKDLHRLNIGAANAVEPMLQEAPLGFVGRYWEMTRPRGNTMQTGENVGEITELSKPEETTPAKTFWKVADNVRGRAGVFADDFRGRAGSFADDFRGRAGSFAENFRGKAGSFAEDVGGRAGSIAGNFLKAAQEELSLKPAGRHAHEGGKQHRRDKERSPFGSGGYGSAAAPAAPAESDAAPAVAEAAQQPATAQPAEAAAEAQAACPTASATNTTVPPSEHVPPAAAATASSAKDGAANEANGAAAEANGQKAEEAAGGEAQVDDGGSLVLISASINVGEGAVHKLVVRAADRTKKVAQAFADEHSLGDTVVKPLVKWLKKVESETDKFPIVLNVTLEEIVSGQ